MSSYSRFLRKVLVAASVLMFLGSLAACSGDETDGDAGQQAQAATGGIGPAPTGGPAPQDSGAGDGQAAQDSAAAAGQTGADASGTDNAVDSGPSSSVTIHYWVQSCFSISADGGVTVVTDPYTPSPTVGADVVTVSHEHPDHNNVDGVPGTFEVIRSEGGVGQHEAAGITFTGVATFHDNSGGSQRGNNTVFVWEMESVRFAHLGDLGHVLTDDQILQIGAVDVLMIPTGGGFTIDAPTAVQVAQQLSPGLIIPMHYQMFGGVGPFLDAVPAEWIVEQPGTASITVTAADFAAEGTKVVVLVP
jgi:L-ascorbate metabolism protein UlaG (beta-lactamase superfamily)